MNDDCYFNGNLKDILTDQKILQELNNRFDRIERFYEGLAAVHSKDSTAIFDGWGFIDTKGDLIIPLKYRKVSNFNNGIAEVQFTSLSARINKTLIINRKGETEHYFQGEKLFLPYDLIVPYNDKLFKMLVNKKWGLIDKKGQEVLIANYGMITQPKNGISFLKDGLASFVTGLSLGCISEDGRILIPQEYNEIKIIDDECAIVGKRRVFNRGYHLEYGLYDLIGNKQITSLSYDKIKPSENGLFKVYIGSKNQFSTINKKGEVQSENIIPFELDVSYKLSDNDSFVCRQNNAHDIKDLTKNKSFNSKYETIHRLVNNLFSAKYEGKFGCIDESDRVLIPFEFEYISFENGFILCEKYDESDSISNMIYYDIDLNKIKEEYKELDPENNDEGIEWAEQRVAELEADLWYDQDQDTNYYNSNLDLDQQDPEFWDSL